MTKIHPPPIFFTMISIATRAILAGVIGIFPLYLSANPVRSNEPITLNFQAAEIEAVARTFATITGMNVVVDPRVKGTITLVTEKPVSRSAAMGQFVSALRLQGFTLVESAGLYKVVPEADAKLQTDGVIVNEGEGSRSSTGNQVATQIFSLNFESANNLVPILRPLISPNNTINANPGNNTLVITDYADNLRRIGRIIAAMDVANATDVQVLPLKHAIASDLAPLVLKLIGASATASTGQADTSFKTTLVAEPRSNALILRAANAAQLALITGLVDKLDQSDASGSGDMGNIHVVYLKNAEASKIANTLRAALAGTATSASSQTNSGTSAPVVTTGGQIQADWRPTRSSSPPPSRNTAKFAP